MVVLGTPYPCFFIDLANAKVEEASGNAGRCTPYLTTLQGPCETWFD